MMEGHSAVYCESIAHSHLSSSTGQVRLQTHQKGHLFATACLVVSDALVHALHALRSKVEQRLCVTIETKLDDDARVPLN